MKHTVSLPIQFRDLDALGHVNSGTIIQYMETARVDMVARMWPANYNPWYRPPFIVASIRCEYKEPIIEEEQVDVKVWTSRIGSKSWDFDYAVEARGTIRAIGRSVQVGYDHDSRRVGDPSPELRAMLEQFYDEPHAFRE